MRLSLTIAHTLTQSRVYSITLRLHNFIATYRQNKFQNQSETKTGILNERQVVACEMQYQQLGWIWISWRCDYISTFYLLFYSFFFFSFQMMETKPCAMYNGFWWLQFVVRMIAMRLYSFVVYMRSSECVCMNQLFRLFGEGKSNL